MRKAQTKKDMLEIRTIARSMKASNQLITVFDLSLLN